MEWTGFRPLTSTYVHSQTSISHTWIITHNLDKHPSVTVVDTGDNVVIGYINYNSVNQLTLTFFAAGDALAVDGKAYLN